MSIITALGLPYEAKNKWSVLLGDAHFTPGYTKGYKLVAIPAVWRNADACEKNELRVTGRRVVILGPFKGTILMSTTTEAEVFD